MSITRITESPSLYRFLDKMDTQELVSLINREDQTVAASIKAVLPAITNLVDVIVARIKNGGRLFYIGAGTSGRLGVLDASECPPTYGVSVDLVVGIMAGGDRALRYGIEDAEDDPVQGWKDFSVYNPNENDVIIGLAASGTTPYVKGALQGAKKNNITTGCIVCNPGSPIAELSDYPIEAIVGPEFVTGSTRMKSGTAQKMILNMISTSVMIRLGKVEDNRMTHLQISNIKLVDRGAKLFMELTGVTDYEAAKKMIVEHGDLKSAMAAYQTTKIRKDED